MQGQDIHEPVEVLLVEDSPEDARIVQLVLSEGRGAMAVSFGLFAVTRVARLEEALNLLDKKRFAVVLLDLGLPDSVGLETLAAVRAAATSVPIVILTGIDDDGLALAAIQQGAQDYLAKDHLEGRLLSRTIRHAIERKRAEIELLRHNREVEAARAQIEQQAVELKARAEQLDRTNRDLDDFTYIASHDLKEPLRGISAYCEILREDYEDKLDSGARCRLDALVKMCDRLATLVDNLLTYSRVGSVRPPDDLIDLHALAEEAIASLRPTIDRRDALVRIVGRLPKVRGDSTVIGMVFGNLISNALKFNDGGRAEVEIGVLAGDPATIYVKDNGIGIEQKHYDDIFTIFRRLHGRKKYEGTGAGLTIVRKIVQSHGGRIWLESELGRETTFFFTLAPAAESRSQKHPTRPPHWLDRKAPAKRGR